jgi:PAS domain S-box-containing protein
MPTSTLQTDLLEAVAAAVYTTDAEGRLTFYNQAAADLWGWRPELGNQHWCGSWKLFWPDGRPLAHADCPMALAIREGRAVRGVEAIAERPDGTRVPFLPFPTPLRDATGRITGALNLLVDITEQKQAQQLQQLLIDELNHRVKNSLATVQAIASLSLLHAKDQTEFVSSFTGRIQALARAHSVLTRTQMQNADVATLVREQVLLGGADDDRVACVGPHLMVDSLAAVHLAMVLHELATNARKYGALSVPDGLLSIGWEMRTNGGRTLLFHWRERNGPPVSAPAAHGFGTTLIQQTLKSHGGKASIEYAAHGVSCEMTLPLPDQERTGVAPLPRPSLAASAPARSRASGDPRGLRNKRILIVEDEPLLSMELEAILAAAGCEVVGSAESVARAKALVADVECDAALVDINLAGQPIDDVAAALRQKRIPFAFVTGYGREALPPGFREAAVLGKPFDQEQLLTLLGGLLNEDEKVVRLRPKGSERP